LVLRLEPSDAARQPKRAMTQITCIIRRPCRHRVPPLQPIASVLLRSPSQHCSLGLFMKHSAYFVEAFKLLHPGFTSHVISRSARRDDPPESSPLPLPPSLEICNAKKEHSRYLKSKRPILSPSVTAWVLCELHTLSWSMWRSMPASVPSHCPGNRTLRR
jgi:hypothetical protein